jgi:NAD(P)-dependent dehydrogenase (short-subunit alcohol dehydrogenase family)
MPSSRLILITGASRGLGRVMAEVFATRGHRVIGCARSKGPMNELQEQLGEPHHFSSLDVSDDTAVAGYAQNILSEIGTPDLLINGAAIINQNAPLWEISAHEIEEILSVNLAGTANFIRHFTPAMIKKGSGVIVNFSSGWGRSTSSEVAPYCATKWGIEGLTQALSQELPDGLAAVAFNPGIIDTDMLRSCLGKEAGRYASPKAWAEAAVPFLEALGPSDNGGSLSCPGH